jgi:hypothetical protein
MTHVEHHVHSERMQLPMPRLLDLDLGQFTMRLS